MCELPELVCREHGELFDGDAPIQLRADIVQHPLLLLNVRFIDGALVCYLEVVYLSEKLQEPYRPLGGVETVPLVPVSVIHGELVVEVLVPLAHGYEAQQVVVSVRLGVVVGSGADGVAYGVDGEDRVLHKQRLQKAAVEQASHVVVPQVSAEQARQDQADQDVELEVVLHLPLHNLLVGQLV